MSQIFERDQDEKSLELQQPLMDKSDSGIDETVRILRTVNDDAEQEDDWKFQSHSFDRLPRTLRLPYERTWFQVLLSWFVATLFLALLLCRFVSLVFKAVHETHCFLRDSTHSMRCSNFTLVSFPLQNTTGWLCVSVITSTICLLALPTIPEFRGYKHALRKLTKRSHFYSIVLLLVLVLIYHALLMVTSEVPINKAISGLFMSEKILATFTVFAFNFLRPPQSHDSYPALRVMYYAAVVSALIENAYLFLRDTLDTTFTISAKERFSHMDESLDAVMVMLLAIEATFRLTIASFFWQKLFHGNKDIFSDMKYLDDI